MHAITALMVSQALADEHRRTAERRRQAQQARASKAQPRRTIAWPFRILRPSTARTGA
jgi:hypothetical protein